MKRLSKIYLLYIGILVFVTFFLLVSNARAKQDDGILAAPPISLSYYLFSDCRNIVDAYSGVKQYCPATVVIPTYTEDRHGNVLERLPYLSRVEVNWTDPSGSRYFVNYCSDGSGISINICSNPSGGFVDKNKILLDVDVVPQVE